MAGAALQSILSGAVAARTRAGSGAIAHRASQRQVSTACRTGLIAVAVRYLTDSVTSIASDRAITMAMRTRDGLVSAAKWTLSHRLLLLFYGF